MAPLVRTGGSRHTGLAALPHRNIQRYIQVKLTKSIELKRHIKPILTIFANSVATTIYVNADTTMIGLLSGDYYVGLYALAVKIYNVIKTMLAAIYSVAIPRISFLVGQNDKEKIKQVFTSVCTALTIILLPAAIGLAAISREVVIIMGGTEYLDSVLTLQILSLSLIGAVFGGLFTYCLNIPLGREKINVKATTISALVNVGLNIIVIPIFKHNGAAFTTVVAEFFVLLYCWLSCKDLKDYLDISAFKKSLFQSFVGCMTILIVSFLVKCYCNGILAIVVLVIVLSIILYALELIFLKNEIVMKLLQKLRR
ncbi:oligosaccharide flippase family protein [Blautia massiliensis (ex Durand et al. 2017)]|uniref:Colanic acid exporter n=1 Tax=Blautia luti TaxID=89014 RepID=A0A564W8A2_9FIRM|nr:colanic acid exporter [Blautia luti]